MRLKKKNKTKDPDIMRLGFGLEATLTIFGSLYRSLNPEAKM